MWFASTAAAVVSLGFSFCCNSFCPHGSEALWRSTGPLALGGRFCSATDPLGFLQSVHGDALHSDGAHDSGLGSSDGNVPEGATGGFKEQESGERVHFKDSWGFCSHNRSVSDASDGWLGVEDDTFFLRWRIMLHWRAMTFWSHCVKTAEQMSKYWLNNEPQCVMSIVVLFCCKLSPTMWICCLILVQRCFIYLKNEFWQMVFSRLISLEVIADKQLIIPQREIVSWNFCWV